MGDRKLTSLEIVRELSPMEAVSALFVGFRMFTKNREIRRLFMKSLVLNAVLFLLMVIGIFWGSFALTSSWVTGVWYVAILGWITRVLVIAALVLVAPTFYILVCDIFLPVYHGAIFEKAREWAGGAPVHINEGAKKELKFVLVDVRRLGRLLLLSAALLLLNFVPVIGSIVYFVAQVLVAGHTLGWDLLGRHLELYDIEYQDQRRFIRSRRSLVTTVGVVAGLLCLIPVLQLVFITTNVAGAGVMSAWMDGAPTGDVEDRLRVPST